jgi:hypothetical protein
MKRMTTLATQLTGDAARVVILVARMRSTSRTPARNDAGVAPAPVSTVITLPGRTPSSPA